MGRLRPPVVSPAALVPKVCPKVSVNKATGGKYSGFLTPKPTGLPTGKTDLGRGAHGAAEPTRRPSPSPAPRCRCQLLGTRGASLSTPHVFTKKSQPLTPTLF